MTYRNYETATVILAVLGGIAALIAGAVFKLSLLAITVALGGIAIMVLLRRRLTEGALSEEEAVKANLQADSLTLRVFYFTAAFVLIGVFIAFRVRRLPLEHELLRGAMLSLGLIYLLMFLFNFIAKLVYIREADCDDECGDE